uniref:DUF4252 domain-containing protein n=1 Tax=uncultured Draconibacterium sp. TaxID=1573823 RepID=UPI0032178433
MKKITVIVLALVISLPVLAQQSQSIFKQLTDRYAEEDGFSASMLTSDMFELYLKKKNVEEDSEIAEALNNLDNILVVAQSKFNLSKEEAFFAGKKNPSLVKEDLENLHKEVIEHYKNAGYSLLKTEKRMGEDVKVYLKKEDERIASLVLLTNSSASTNLVELNGDIDLATVASLSKIINLRGLENLYKIDNSSSYVGQFPSAGYFEMSEERMAEMEARAREMAERHAELSEEQRAKIEQQAQLQAQKQMEMTEKYREMAEKYGRQPIFLSAPGDTNTVYYINGKKVKSENIKKRLQDEEIKQIVKSYNEEEGGTVIKITTK